MRVRSAVSVLMCSVLAGAAGVGTIFIWVSSGAVPVVVSLFIGCFVSAGTLFAMYEKKEVEFREY